MKLAAFSPVLFSGMLFMSGCADLQNNKYLNQVLKIETSSNTPYSTSTLDRSSTSIAKTPQQASFSASNIKDGVIDFNNFIFFYQSTVKQPLSTETIAGLIDPRYKASKNEFERKSALDEFTTQYSKLAGEVKKGQKVSFSHYASISEYDFKRKGFYIKDNRFSFQPVPITERFVVNTLKSNEQLFIPFEEAAAKQFIAENRGRWVKFKVTGVIDKAYSQRTEELVTPRTSNYPLPAGFDNRVTYFDYILELNVDKVIIWKYSS